MTIHPNRKYPKGKRDHKEILKTIFSNPVADGTFLRNYVKVYRNNGIHLIKEIHLFRISQDSTQWRY